LKIVDCLTTNGDKGKDYRLCMDRETMLIGLAKAICTLLLEIVSSTLYFRTASETAVPGRAAPQLRDEFDVHQQSDW
jgi:hypothetical protein